MTLDEGGGLQTGTLTYGGKQPFTLTFCGQLTVNLTCMSFVGGRGSTLRKPTQAGGEHAPLQK